MGKSETLRTNLGFSSLFFLIFPACESMCVCCPALRSRSRQPVKHYKKLLSEIFPKSPHTFHVFFLQWHFKDAFFFLIPRMLTSYDSFRVPEYCEKHVKPKDVVGAEEVKSIKMNMLSRMMRKSPKNRSLGTYYALHTHYENCLVLYMMFSSRKIRTRQNRGIFGKIPTYPLLSLLSMDVCTLKSNSPICSYSLCACINYTTVYYALLVFIYTLVDLTLVMTYLAANGIYISHISNTLWWNPF
ncbi:hypothetical protein CXB51_015029 [Gossypium anomalum]|uniref:Uncharacterized protein n=1 Tax=Gossypium anomalum TaxID=47600 RepID=A0A8J5ZAY0_9ROSI|nr:hypothetical protein CXB51_015029 [Gossypium anomalum]